MSKSIKYLVFGGGSFLLLSIIVFLMNDDPLSNISLGVNDYDEAVERQKSEFYNGVIIDKFIDERMYKRVVLKNSVIPNDTLIFNFISGGVYEYLMVGDSLDKKEGELKLNLTREGRDSIVHLQIMGFLNENK